MPMTFEIGKTAAQMFVFTFCDPDPNKESFIDLAAYDFKTVGEADRHWDMLAEVDTATSNFIVDRYDHTGMIANKVVAAETMETITGQPIATLIRNGQAMLQQAKRDMQHELDARMRERNRKAKVRARLRGKQRVAA